VRKKKKEEEERNKKEKRRKIFLKNHTRSFLNFWGRVFARWGTWRSPICPFSDFKK